MAASFASATETVMGDQRVFMGVVHMNDGAESLDFGMSFRSINFFELNPYSASTVGFLKWGIRDSASSQGYARVRITSVTSGDAFWALVMGK